MKIALIAVGKLKTAYWAAAQQEYLERLRRYAPLRLVEIKDRVGRGQDERAAVKKEGEDILSAAAESALIALTPAGGAFTSPAWAQALRKWSDTYPRLSFVIGGPSGLSEDVLKKSRHPLSLSAMTFPHELARVVFLEQLYRAFTLLGGEKYHK